MKKIVLFLMTLGLQTPAWAVGNEIANGGDSVAAEFIYNGQVIINYWKQLDLPADFDVDAEQFAAIVREAVVETKESVDIDGRVVDAINIPGKKRIVVNRTRWAQIDAYKKIVIVFHEYVGLISASDRNFEVAPRVVQSLTSIVSAVGRPTFGEGSGLRLAISEIRCTGLNAANGKLGFRVMLDELDHMVSLEVIEGETSKVVNYSGRAIPPSHFVKRGPGGIEMFGIETFNDGLEYDKRVFWVKNAPQMSVLQTRYYSEQFTAVKEIECTSRNLK